MYNAAVAVDHSCCQCLDIDNVAVSDTGYAFQCDVTLAVELHHLIRIESDSYFIDVAPISEHLISIPRCAV